MPVRIEHHDYGKARVRMLRVTRRGDVHDIRELAVRIVLEGGFEASYVSGDNRDVLPTDSMKNAVYALAKEKGVERLEGFGRALAAHFLDTHRVVTRATVDLEEPVWARVLAPGAERMTPHPHAFVLAGSERATARIAAERGAERIESGLQGLRLLRTTGSGFEGFARDRFTTLRETRERILSTEVSASWSWREPPKDFAVENSRVREALVQAFAAGYSPSVQHTLHEMGTAALAACAALERIRLSLPNLHCVPVDLAPFGLENQNEVFIPTDEPHGVIEATIARE